MSEKKSFSDYVRDYIIETHQKNEKYFEETSVSKRNSDFSLYCTTNKSKGLDYAKHRSLFTQILGKIAKEKNIKLQKQLASSPQQKYEVTKGLQKGNITVKPTQGTEPTTTDATQQTTQSNQTGTTQQTTQKTDQVVLHPPMCQCMTCKQKRGEIPDITPDEAGGILEIIIDFWHSRNPNVQPMTEEEVLKVGKRLQPILQRHLGGDLLVYGMGAIAIAQVLTKRVDQARAGKKAKTYEEKQQKSQEEQEQKRDYSDTPTKGSNTEQIQTPPNRKFFSSKKIDEIMNLKDADDDEEKT